MFLPLLHDLSQHQDYRLLLTSHGEKGYDAPDFRKQSQSVSVNKTSMALSAVLWDMDGTFLDIEPVQQQTIDNALKQLGYEVGSEFHHNLLGDSGVDVHRLYPVVI